LHALPAGFCKPGHFFDNFPFPGNTVALLLGAKCNAGTVESYHPGEILECFNGWLRDFHGGRHQ
jgi:hypothetical protein